MNTKHLKARILDLALQGKLVENSRIPTDLNSRIPTDFNPPFKIPNSWAWVNISDICNSITAGGDKPKNISNTKTQDFQIPIYTNAVANQGLYGYTDKPTITNEAITISARGTIGYAAIRTEPFYPIVRLIVLSLNSNLTLTKFIYFAILSLGIKSEGTSTPQLTIPSLKKQLFIPLPPKDEQEKIVKKIDELFEQIDILETSKQNLLKNIKHTKTRILDLALQGKLVENSKISEKSNFGIPTDFKPPFGIPNSWAWVKLGDICDFQNGFAFKSKDFKNSGYFVIKIANIQNNEITKENAVFCEPEICENLENFSVKRGDILIAMSGATTGKIGIYNLDEKAFLNQRVGLFKNFSKNIDKRFFYFVLLTKVEESLKIAIGSAQPNLSTEQIKSFYIPLPPLDEQERIVKKIDELFEILEVIKNSL
ncbi:restriction endonuclease subunit S [Campylobacter sp.]|uniref:restriction endonuclease subunit S n=1 Tax=Campylobacter sp. TaxID=205 RepID=UPI002A7569CF|nr:restriction endonuclease subunit S [Campylobacter sp.]MDY2763327.1 restriction endonuclease subunit S [Campylobacter sp.]